MLETNEKNGDDRLLDDGWWILNSKKEEEVFVVAIYLIVWEIGVPISEKIK